MKLLIGRVIGNKQFPKTGYIDVLLPQEHEEMGLERALSGEFDAEKIKSVLPEYSEGFGGNGLTQKCRVISPLGVADNYGMFALPQINSLGLVAKLEYENEDQWSSESKNFWLGGIYGGFMLGETISLPYDDTDSESLEHEDNPYISGNVKNGDFYEEQNTITGSPYESEGMFLVKLKTCEEPNLETVDEKTNEKLHYKNIPCNNAFVMRKTRTTLRYNEYDDDNKRIGISDLTFDRSKSKLSRYTNFEKTENRDDTRTEQYLVLDDDKVELRFLNKKNKVDRILSFDNEQMKLQYDDPDKKNNVTIIIGRDGTINIDATKDANINIGGNAKVVVDKDINIKNNKGCQINMGNKFSINNNNGDLFTLLNRLYEELIKLVTIDTEGKLATASPKWSQFAVRDIMTLKALMETHRE